MERAETDWDRPSESAPRWRALLDRALLGRSGEQSQVGDQAATPPDRPDLARQEPVRPEYPTPPNYRQSGHARPEHPVSGYPRPDYPDYPPPDYPPPNHPLPDHLRPGHAQPGYVQPGYVQPGHAQPGYVQPGHVQPGYVQPGHRGPTYGRAQPPTDIQTPAYTRAVSHPPASTTYRPGIEWPQQRADSVESSRDVDVLRRDIGGPRVLAFANPKGGVHKTTATVLTAAAVGGVRGRGVIAWDDNELRGTLGLRAGSARHARTIRHLVADLARVESSSGLELTELLDSYLRHASDGSYDVLAGEENPRFAQRLDQFTVRRVLELLRRTHDVICVDTGNNVESENWRTVLQVADQLVVTTLPREDAAFSADWMLDVLEEIGLGQLVADAVTVVSCPTPNPSPLLDDLVKHFGTRTRTVAVVPFDPTLETGSSIDHEVLQPATKKAWLAAAAMMLEPFAH